MQALERIHPTKPTRPGLIERQEFEYKRHGTLTLFANFEVATGRLIAPTVISGRKEEDFLAHVSNTVDTEPEATWIFVLDQLNIHMSTSLVRFVAERCGFEGDLGRPRSHGILRDRRARREFLSKQTHRIRFIYTPRHCSWLNQIEIWFGVLSRKLLKRSAFNSSDDLRAKVLRFIEYYNAVLSKPYNWTYTGRPLQGLR